MVERNVIEHHIQKHIMSVLMNRHYARFRDMRPENVETNLYSYHLKLLLKNGYVKKTDDGYALDIAGQIYVDRINATTAKLSAQPKVITMSVIQDGYGGVLMYKKLRQPFIDRWTVPFGKVHNSDALIAAAARREIHEKVGDVDVDLRHAGDCYIRVMHEDEIVISTLAHVFYGQVDTIPTSKHFEWIPPHKITDKHTAPAVEQIITRTFFRDPYFFEEYTEQLIQ